MNRPPVYGHGRLVHPLRQRRVGVHGAGEILGASVKLHGGDRFGDQLGGVGAEDVYAEDAIGLAMTDNLDQTGGLTRAWTRPRAR